MSSVQTDPPQPPPTEPPQPPPKDLPQSPREEPPQTPTEEPQPSPEEPPQPPPKDLPQPPPEEPSPSTPEEPSPSTPEEPPQPPPKERQLLRLQNPRLLWKRETPEPEEYTPLICEIYPYIAAMFNLGSKPGLRGSGHVVLNAVRPGNIITLLAIAVVCWIMIVMTGIRRSFFFFDAASHFFTSLIALTLILTELSLLKSYFRRTWPVFSDEHGLAWLGTAMVVMGCQVLGNLNDDAIRPSEVGQPIHSLVLATGILALTFGVVNVATSFLFADRSAGINARMVRSDGNLASAKTPDDGSSRSESVQAEKGSGAANRWTKRLTLAGARRLKISRPIPQQPQDVEAQFQNDGWRDSRSSPIIPEVRRPDTAMHPLNTGVSRYSEATHLPRF